MSSSPQGRHHAHASSEGTTRHDMIRVRSVLQSSRSTKHRDTSRHERRSGDGVSVLYYSSSTRQWGSHVIKRKTKKNTVARSALAGDTSKREEAFFFSHTDAPTMSQSPK